MNDCVYFTTTAPLQADDIKIKTRRITTANRNYNCFTTDLTTFKYNSNVHDYQINWPISHL